MGNGRDDVNINWGGAFQPFTWDLEPDYDFFKENQESGHVAISS